MVFSFDSFPWLSPLTYTSFQSQNSYSDAFGAFDAWLEAEARDTFFQFERSVDENAAKDSIEMRDLSMPADVIESVKLAHADDRKGELPGLEDSEDELENKRGHA